MADVVKRIGLSLGADVCWPLCYEHIMGTLDLAIPVNGDTVRFDIRRMTIDPYPLDQPCGYDLLIDRLTHWYQGRREYIKQAVLHDDVYVLNNPWSVQSAEKHTTYAAMIALGMPIPKTWLIPPKAYAGDNPDLAPTLARYAQLFDLGAVGEEVGFPAFLKPYDGGGWREVTRVSDAKAAKAAYEESGTSVMHLQAAVKDWDLFVRGVGFGPQVHFVRYDPDGALHDRYTMDRGFMDTAAQEHLRKVTLTINAFFGWDFNSCEALRAHTVWHPIDFANPCPDSQVTSLHYHFPWMVKAYLRWSIFCAATSRKMRRNLDWEPFYEVARAGGDYETKLAGYAEIAERRFDTDRFDAFCHEHLGHLDEVAWEFFGSTTAQDAIRKKVVALFPAHEVERFTELFWNRIQRWRADNETPSTVPPSRQ